MTADNRAAQAAHDALARMTEDVIAGRIAPTAPHDPAQNYAPDAYAQPQQYIEPQAYAQYQPGQQPADPAAEQNYSLHYAPETQPDPYAHTYTPEQQAAAEAYAAQFAESIGQTAVASATQYQPQPQPEPVIQPVAAPEVAPQVAEELPPVPPIPVLPSEAVAPAAVPPPVVVKEKRQGVGLFTYLTAIVALASLGMSFYQGFLFHRSIDLMEKNVARGEFIRACRDIIGTYFDVKQKVGILMPAADRGNIAGAARVTEANRVEAQAAIARFGGLGTYLANFQDIPTRERYTELTRTLNGILDVARTTPLVDIDKTFAPADKLFAGMNDDCVKLSRQMRM